MLKINAAGDVGAKSNTTGADIPEENITVTNAVGGQMYLFRSVPSVTLNGALSDGLPRWNTLPSGINSGLELYKLAIAAAGQPDTAIGVGRVSFQVGLENVAVAKWYLYANSLLVASSTQVTSNGLVVLDSNPAFFIPAASSTTYILKGDVNCSSENLCAGTSGTGYLQIDIVRDASFFSPVPDSLNNIRSAGTINNFLWSDFWKTPTLHLFDPDYMTENQWSNSYLVPGPLGSSPVTFSR